jgi:hypothetical protein
VRGECETRLAIYAGRFANEDIVRPGLLAATLDVEEELLG